MIYFHRGWKKTYHQGFSSPWSPHNGQWRGKLLPPVWHRWVGHNPSWVSGWNPRPTSHEIFGGPNPSTSPPGCLLSALADATALHLRILCEGTGHPSHPSHLGGGPAKAIHMAHIWPISQHFVGRRQLQIQSASAPQQNGTAAISPGHRRSVAAMLQRVGVRRIALGNRVGNTWSLCQPSKMNELIFLPFWDEAKQDGWFLESFGAETWWKLKDRRRPLGTSGASEPTKLYPGPDWAADCQQRFRHRGSEHSHSVIIDNAEKNIDNSNNHWSKNKKSNNNNSHDSWSQWCCKLGKLPVSCLLDCFTTIQLHSRLPQVWRWHIWPPKPWTRAFGMPLPLESICSSTPRGPRKVCWMLEGKAGGHFGEWNLVDIPLISDNEDDFDSLGFIVSMIIRMS